MTKETIRFIGEIVVAIAAAIGIALGVRSNYLLQQQMKPNVIRVSSDYVASATDIISEGKYVPHCLHKMRLANTGTVSDSVVGYDTRVTYQGKEQRWSSDESYAVEPDLFAAGSSAPGDGPALLYFESAVLRDWDGMFKHADSYGDQLIDFAVEVPAAPAIDLYFQLDFDYNNPRGVLAPSVVAGQSFDSNKLDQYSLVEVSYVLKLASGAEVETPDMPCQYLADYVFTD